MSPLQLCASRAKKILFRVFAFTLFMVLSNRLFLLFFGRSIWVSDRFIGGTLGTLVSMLMIFVLLVIFPVIYLWQMRYLLTAGTLQSLWGEYRDDVCDLVVGRVADICVEHTGGVAEGAQALLARTEQVMDGFPRLVKRVLGWLQQKVPLFDEVFRVLREVDLSAIGNSKQLKAEIMTQLEPFLSREQGGSSLVNWSLAVINVLFLVGVFVVVKGYV